MGDGAYTRPYVTWGTIVGRSSEEPAAPETLSYEVEIHFAGQTLTVPEVSPSNRTSEQIVDADSEVDVIPFAVGEWVLIGVDPRGAQDEVRILSKEDPAPGPCEEEG